MRALTLLSRLPALACAAAIALCAAVLYTASAQAQSSAPQQTAYVTNATDGTVSAVDTATGTVGEPIPMTGGRGIPDFVGASALTPDGARLYVVGSGYLAVVDSTTGAVKADIPTGVGAGPGSGLLISHNGQRAYIATISDIAVVSIPEKKTIATIPTRSLDVDIVMSPDGSRIYAIEDQPGLLLVIDTRTNKVINKIKVDGSPTSIALSRNGSVAYVSGVFRKKGVTGARDRKGLTVLDTATGTVIASIPFSFFPGQVTLSPDDSVAYVLGGGNITVVSTATDKVTAKVDTGCDVESMTISPGGRQAYLDCGGTTIAEMDIPADTVIVTIHNGATPDYLQSPVTFSPDGAAAYVLNDTTVSVIDTATQTIAATIPVGNEPISVTFSRSGATAYVSNYNDGTVSVIDATTSTVRGVIPNNFDGPNAVAVSPDGSLVYVAGVSSSTIRVIEAATGKLCGEVISAGGGVSDIAFAPDGATAYATSRYDSTVSVIDTATGSVSATIPVGAHPNTIVVSPSGTTAYTLNVDDTISVIDLATDSVSSTINVPYRAEGVNSMALSPDGSMLYVAGSLFNTVTAIDTATGLAVKTVYIDSTPNAVTFSPDGSAAYVTVGSGVVDEIDTATGTVLTTITVGLGPMGMVVTPDGTEVLVANTGTNTVSVISTATEMTTATITVGTGTLNSGYYGIAV